MDNESISLVIQLVREVGLPGVLLLAVLRYALPRVTAAIVSHLEAVAATAAQVKTTAGIVEQNTDLVKLMASKLPDVCRAPVDGPVIDCPLKGHIDAWLRDKQEEN